VLLKAPDSAQVGLTNGQIVGTGRVADMTKDEVLGMIILGKRPPGAIPGPGATKS
jgi:D-xylose transport system ATP-binding protein